ncbi:MAG TPA: hypothetical protein VGO52_01455 [Hyphomonadaceae bacterium]|jgi:hypothetical protein|nr:hypothetical protein [Hyphomonadaceae bacterium]
MADTHTDITHDAEAPPKRGKKHEALSVFLGDWEAEGTSYGGPKQDAKDPKANGFAWASTLTARWHSGEFFLIQVERAQSGGQFDTTSVMGVDAQTDEYFAQSFENHGFARRYDVRVDGETWTLLGEHERAMIVFSEDGRTQTITWEWKPRDKWLPLCDRVAKRVAHGQARA